MKTAAASQTQLAHHLHGYSLAFIMQTAAIRENTRLSTDMAFGVMPVLHTQPASACAQGFSRDFRKRLLPMPGSRFIVVHC